VFDLHNGSYEGNMQSLRISDGPIDDTDKKGTRGAIRAGRAVRAWAKVIGIATEWCRGRDSDPHARKACCGF